MTSRSTRKPGSGAAQAKRSMRRAAEEAIEEIAGEVGQPTKTLSHFSIFSNKIKITK